MYIIEVFNRHVMTLRDTDHQPIHRSATAKLIPLKACSAELTASRAVDSPECRFPNSFAH